MSNMLQTDKSELKQKKNKTKQNRNQKEKKSARVPFNLGAAEGTTCMYTFLPIFSLTLNFGETPKRVCDFLLYLLFYLHIFLGQ